MFERLRKSRWLAPFKRDLSIQLLALYLLFAIPLLAGLLIFDRVEGQEIEASVKTSDLSLARAIAKESDLSIHSMLDAIERLSRHPAVIDADPAGMKPIFSVVSDTRPEINLIYRLNQNGIMLYHFPEGPGSTIGTDFSFREYFQRAMSASTPLFSEGRISPTTQQAVATAVMPIRTQDDQFSGVIAVNIRLESLTLVLDEILAEQDPVERYQIYILDQAGKVIAHPHQEELLRNARELMPPLFLDALQRGSFSTIANDLISGEEMLYTVAPINSVSWTVVITRPTSTAFAQKTFFHRIAIGAAITFMLLGLSFWRVLFKKVIEPVEKLSAISAEIGGERPVDAEKREYLEHEARRPDQIGSLIAGLLRLERSIQAQMNEEAALLEMSHAVVSSLDPQIVLDRILEQAARLLNVEKMAIVALDEDEGLFRTRASRGLTKHYAEQLSIQPDEPLSVTMRALRSGNPVEISDMETDPTVEGQRSRARIEGYRSMIAIPLKTQHTPPTALLVYRPGPHVYSASELGLLVSFANYATMAIENAALYARSDKNLQEQTLRIESLIHSMQDGLVMGDLKGNVVYANRRIIELAQLEADNVALDEVSLPSIMERIIQHSADPGKARAEIEQVLNNTISDAIEFSIALNSRTIILRMQAFEVTNPQGVSLGQGIVFKDITTDRELDRMKSSLISTVSHELRTPLASIKGYASTLLADDVEWDRKSQREFLEIISAESDRLSELVNDLLDMSRIEAGNLQLRYIECVIPDVIQSAARRAHLLPSIDFKVNVAPNLPPLFADPMRLETILRNLIENSIKYAGEQASIQIDVTQSGGNAIFHVQDDGPGIPLEQSTRIFESFYRLGDRLSHTAGGAGLGLAICQGFVRAHNGDIWVEPCEDGACIGFSIPFKPQEDHE